MGEYRTRRSAYWAILKEAIPAAVRLGKHSHENAGIMVFLVSTLAGSGVLGVMILRWMAPHSIKPWVLPVVIAAIVVAATMLGAGEIILRQQAQIKTQSAEDRVKRARDLFVGAWNDLAQCIKGGSSFELLLWCNRIGHLMMEAFSLNSPALGSILPKILPQFQLDGHITDLQLIEARNESLKWIRLGDLSPDFDPGEGDWSKWAGSQEEYIDVSEDAGAILQALIDRTAALQTQVDEYNKRANKEERNAKQILDQFHNSMRQPHPIITEMPIRVAPDAQLLAFLDAYQQGTSWKREHVCAVLWKLEDKAGLPKDVAHTLGSETTFIRALVDSGLARQKMPPEKGWWMSTQESDCVLRYLRKLGQIRLIETPGPGTEAPPPS